MPVVKASMKDIAKAPVGEGTITYTSYTVRAASEGGNVITAPGSWVQPIEAGAADTVDLEPGPYEVEISIGWFVETYNIIVAPTPAEQFLHELITDYLAIPPATAQQRIADAVAAYIAANPGIGGGLSVEEIATAATTETPLKTTLDAHYVPLWQASTDYAINAPVTLPNGKPAVRTAAGTSRAQFDATELALWTLTGGGTTTVDGLTDATTVGKAVAKASSPAVAREAIGAASGGVAPVLLDTTDWMDLVTDANGRIARGITPQGEHFLRLASSAVVPGSTVAESSLPASALTAAAPIDLGRRQSKFAEVTGTTPNRSLYVNDIYSGKRVLIASTGDPRDPIMFPDGWVHWTDDTGPRAAKGDGSTGVRLVGSDMTKIVVEGGSLAFGVGASNNQGYTYLLGQELTSKTVFNGGRAGETSACSNLRSGALILTFAAFTIPAATTAVTVAPIVDIDWPSDQDFTWTGTIGGIAGTLAHAFATNLTTFTRTTAGSATPVAAGTAFVSSTATHMADVKILHFNGQNEMKVQSNVFGSVFDRLKKAHLDAVAAMTPHSKRFLILGSTTSSTQIAGTWQHAQALAVDAWLAATYPDNFFNLRNWLIANGLTLQGLTATTADNTAIAGNTIPPQLLTDGLHYTDGTHAIVKTKIVAELNARGWIS